MVHIADVDAIGGYARDNPWHLGMAAEAEIQVTLGQKLCVDAAVG